MRLLLAFLIFLEAVESSKKLHEVLKNVGKRYNVWELSDAAKRDILLRIKHRDWAALPETEVEKIKTENAKNLVHHFLEVSSSENKYFEGSLKWISSIMSPNMTAQLCGGQPFNAYQYTKYMSDSGAHYKKTADKTYPLYEVVKTPRDTLQVNMKFTQMDSFSHNLYMHYDVTLNLTFIRDRNESVFSITHINQGGTCLDNGTYRYSTLKEDSEFLDHLKSHPDALILMNLFTPKIFLSSQSATPKKIPDFWLSGLDSRGAFIEVCHDGETDVVRYSNDQFRSWYKRFRMMWHPVSEDYVKIQTENANEDTVVARITMTLQMGNLNGTHDWDFKISIKRNLHGDQKWYINQFEVKCAPTVDYKDQSLRVIRDIVIDEFLESVENLPRPIPWYSSVEFVKEFTKNGTVDVEFCDAQIRTNLTQIQFHLYHQTKLRDGFIFTVILDSKSIMLTAEKSSYFNMKTLSSPDNRPPYDYVYEHEWHFELKWDFWDQFYYIKRLQIGCGSEISKKAPNFLRLSLCGLIEEKECIKALNSIYSENE